MTARFPALAIKPAVRECERLTSHPRRVFTLLDIWRQRFHDRWELARMDERSLRDLGLTPYDALYEARKPFWRE